MSYILEALRKAERERQLGRTPTLADVTHAPPGAGRGTAPRRSWRPLWLVLLVVALGALFLWRRPAPAPQPVPAPLASAPAEAGPAEAREDESLDTLLVGEALEEEPPQEPDSAASAEMPEPAEAGRAVEADTPGATPGFPALRMDTRLLREQAPDFRAGFPALRLDVHVFHEDPARRWVMLNGARYTEGMTLAEGPQLQQITAEGVVVEFRGRKVQVPVKP